MSRIIEILLDEHRNIEKLLHILEQELEIFDRGQIGDAEAEHQAETNRLRQFARAVEDVLAGRELLRQDFHNVVRDFIEHQRQHIAKEERSLFPSAVKALRPEDWVEINTRLNERKDPLFDNSTEKKFHALQQTIVRWEQETEVNRMKG
jgi:hemerythrin-like domain-containing protein